jgi:hypothetical protein
MARLSASRHACCDHPGVVFDTPTRFRSGYLSSVAAPALARRPTPNLVVAAGGI